MGYKNRRQAVEESLLREFKEVTDEFECERLNFLCHLIEENILDIKVTDKISDFDDNDMVMFHEKIGLFIDENENKVAFSGSLNESDNAFSKNFESIQVFKSWEEPKRVAIMEGNFERLWEDKTNTLEVYDFPEAVRNALFKYRKANYHRDIDEYEKRERVKRKIVDIKPSINLPFDLYDYQNKTFRNPETDENYKAFEEYVLGVLEEIYDKLMIKSNTNYQDYLTSLNKLLNEFNPIETDDTIGPSTDDFF